MNNIVYLCSHEEKDSIPFTTLAGNNWLSPEEHN